jgi:hypothetical protein
MSNLALASLQNAASATWQTTAGINYGHDLFCIQDLDPGMIEVDGRVCLAQAIARRLMTPRGGLIDDTNYGYDLTAFINDDITASAIGRMQGQIVAECMKDQRVVGASASVIYTAQQLIVTISITDGVGPFPLVLAVSAVTVQILSIGQL